MAVQGRDAERTPLASNSAKEEQARPSQGSSFVLLCPDRHAHVEKPVDLRQLVQQFSRVAAAFYKGDSKWKARGLTLVLLVFAVSASGVDVLKSYVNRDITTALTGKEAAKFYAAVWKFTAICLLASPFNAAYDYVAGLLVLEWRVWLTELLLAKYFTNKAFYTLKMEGLLDNPDQRICDDVASFVGHSVDIILTLVQSVMSLLGFSAVLWFISPGVFLFLVGYAVAGTAFSFLVFGKKMMWIKFEGLQREANMRYSMVRVRDNVESIAFYRGEQREAASVVHFLHLVVENTRRLLVWNLGLRSYTSTYAYATYMMPIVGLAQSFWDGKIEYGQIVQAAMAFDAIFGALTIIVMKFEFWTELAAETERLESLLTALRVYSGDSSLKAAHAEVLNPEDGDGEPKQGGEGGSDSNSSAKDDVPLVTLGTDTTAPPGATSPMSRGPTIVRLVGSRLVAEGLQIHLPKTGEVLFPQGLSFSLEEGQSLLVMGPSGCGKSSLLRVICGLWSSGRGSVECPPERDLFFLPQKPFMTIGSFRDQLLFPLPASTKGEALDARLYEVLEEVRLTTVLKRFPNGLDEKCDWSDCLSVGEQQRVAFARLFICRHKMAFLDEATSALDIGNERHMYSMMKEQITTYISVGHRLSLVPYHTHVLWFDEANSAWSLVPSQDFKRLTAFS